MQERRNGDESEIGKDDRHSRRDIVPAPRGAKDQKQDAGDDNQETGGDIDRAVSRVLQTPSEAENHVPVEVLEIIRPLCLVMR